MLHFLNFCSFFPSRHVLPRLITFGLAVASTVGCSSYQEVLRGRSVAFPLSVCNEVKLSHAAAVLLQDKELAPVEDKGRRREDRFGDDWVCVTAPQKIEEKDMNEVERLEKQALANSDEENLRKAVEKPFSNSHSGRPNFGLALSGGGTKAAAFATGVMAGLSDLQLLDKANYLSSVSGGGYAAYFYYAHKLMPFRRGEAPPSTNDIYIDCITTGSADFVTDEINREILEGGGCRRTELYTKQLPTKKGDALQSDGRFQAFLKCQQDVFKPGNCVTNADFDDIGIGAEVFLGTAVMIPLVNIATTFWDWGINLSVAARAYREGIGIAYGATVSDIKNLAAAEGGSYAFKCDSSNGAADALDCKSNIYTPDPVQLRFDELRIGYLEAQLKGKPLPFWVINATAPKSRSAFGWASLPAEDVSNSDMFEMTAVSHGSGRYGYVSAPPSLHGMEVLDSVSASAAFLDSNQLVVNNPVRGLIGAGLHVTGLDWGQDIPNYNTSDARRLGHKVPPIPFLWLDSFYARTQEKIWNSPEEVDRARSVYIRLMDGGNAENLGVYSLLKRKVKNIVISDAAQDSDGRFGDICSLSRRLKNAPAEAVAKYIYIPGLKDFEKHCARTGNLDQGYNLHDWALDNPILVGCIRGDAVKRKNASEPCKDLDLDSSESLDTRIFIVKPAVNNARFKTHLLKNKVSKCYMRARDGRITRIDAALNCDTAIYMAESWREDKSGCQTFPQDSTVFMTANSNHRVFTAYRELARQYIVQTGILLQELMKEGGGDSKDMFEKKISQQSIAALKAYGIPKTRGEKHQVCMETSNSTHSAMTSSSL